MRPAFEGSRLWHHDLKGQNFTLVDTPRSMGSAHFTALLTYFHASWSGMIDLSECSHISVHITLHYYITSLTALLQEDSTGQGDQP